MRTKFNIGGESMQKFLILILLIISASCAGRKAIRAPASFHHSKYEAFAPGTKIKLREPVELAHKEETIHSDSRCEIHKYCTFEISNDPLRRLTMRGEYEVDSINESEDKLVLLTSEKEKIQLDCGLKYSLQKINVENDQYCQRLMKEYTIYAFPEFMQTIVDMEISWLDHH